MFNTSAKFTAEPEAPPISWCSPEEFDHIGRLLQAKSTESNRMSSTEVQCHTLACSKHSLFSFSFYSKRLGSSDPFSIAQRRSVHIHPAPGWSNGPRLRGPKKPSACEPVRAIGSKVGSFSAGAKPILRFRSQFSAFFEI